MKPIDWSGSKSYQVMKQALLCKFEQPKMKALLKNTGEQLLAECNKFDQYFGTGLKTSAPKAWNDKKWSGRNKLGSLLMQVRSEI